MELLFLKPGTVLSFFSSPYILSLDPLGKPLRALPQSFQMRKLKLR